MNKKYIVSINPKDSNKFSCLYRNKTLEEAKRLVDEEMKGRQKFYEDYRSDIRANFRITNKETREEYIFNC